MRTLDEVVAMSGRLDEGKLVAWRTRLKSFRSSGLTVAAFCRNERISQASFYYWSRRVREAGTVADAANVDSEQRSDGAATTIEVLIGDRLRVRLPVTDPAWVASVLTNVQASMPESRQGAFERIDLSAAARQ